MRSELILHEQTTETGSVGAKAKQPLDPAIVGNVQPNRPAPQPKREVVQEQRLGALAEMASVIAHDLNNSLTPIIGFSDFLLDSSACPADEHRKCVQGIRKAAGEIAGMVEQMRQFYRRRDLSEQLELVDVNALIREVVNSTVPHDCDSVRVKLRLQKDLPPVEERASDLREAFRQLLTNALEAMPHGGTLVVRARLSQAKDPARVVVEISDSGLGMDPATRARCLEPFFSTKGPRRRGLGLALVHGVMRRHQGRLEIRSELGAGTRVRLELRPALDGKEPVPATAAWI
jgi:signal transduction histidine kinase